MLALIFYVNRSKRVELKFYVICTMLGEITSKASTLFGSIEYAMKRNIIRWENVDSIGLGNSRTNIGRRNSIKSRTFIVGCNWSCISGFNDYKQVKGWGSQSRPPLFFFKGSAGTKYKLFRQYGNMRWLCLEQCCLNKFKIYDGLKSMFLSRGEKNWRKKL